MKLVKPIAERRHARASARYRVPLAMDLIADTQIPGEPSASASASTDQYVSELPDLCSGFAKESSYQRLRCTVLDEIFAEFAITPLTINTIEMLTHLNGGKTDPPLPHARCQIEQIARRTTPQPVNEFSIATVL